VGDTDVLESGRIAQACSQGLGKGFLGGEALGEKACLGLGLLERQPLLLGEDTLGEGVTETRERILDTGDFDDVGADTKDHLTCSRLDHQGFHLADGVVPADE
jgi:hypothetical protein